MGHLNLNVKIYQEIGRIFGYNGFQPEPTLFKGMDDFQSSF